PSVVHPLALHDALPICVFVSHFEWLATEVTVGGGGLVHRVQQFQLVLNGVRAQVEYSADYFGQFFITEFAGAEAVHRYRGRFGHADGVRHLNFTTVSQTRSNDIFRYITGHVRSRTVYFGWVFTGEGTATMTGHTAVGVDNDFTAG